MAVARPSVTLVIHSDCFKEKTLVLKIPGMKYGICLAGPKCNIRMLRDGSLMIFMSLSNLNERAYKLAEIPSFYCCVNCTDTMKHL